MRCHDLISGDVRLSRGLAERALCTGVPAALLWRRAARSPRKVPSPAGLHALDAEPEKLHYNSDTNFIVFLFCYDMIAFRYNFKVFIAVFHPKLCDYYKICVNYQYQFRLQTTQTHTHIHKWKLLCGWVGDVYFNQQIILTSTCFIN